MKQFKKKAASNQIRCLNRKAERRPKQKPAVLPFLKNNEYRTKLFGLRVLRQICRQLGFGFLNYRLCHNAKDFSISHFPKPSSGRLIIRSDPIRKTHTHTMEEWFSMPRLNLYLERQPPKKSEKLVRAWMAQAKKRNPQTRFIVHKARNLADYEMSVQLNVEISNNTVRISKTKARTDKFRDESIVTSQMRIDDQDRIRRIMGQPTLLPESLQGETLTMLRVLIEYAKLHGYSSLETSFVTYKDAPLRPEYYDLIFGKKI